MISVQRYRPEQSKQWDDFVRTSKNGVFLFERDYMDYHADRFTDHSLCFFRDGNLIGLLPANLNDGVLSSHGGLTFGGIVCNQRMKTSWMLEVFETLLDYMREEEIASLLYKPVPHIFHKMPAEEDLYALFRNNATLEARNISAVISNSNKPPYSKGRKWAVKKSSQHDLKIESTVEQLEAFMEIENQLLRQKYASAPVHTGGELRKLIKCFPDRIRLFTVCHDSELLGGTIIYDYGNGVRTQYIASTDLGREKSAIDFLFDELINVTFKDKQYFDFGTSNADDGRYLESSLIQNKEAYGARGIACDSYKLDSTLICES